MPSAVFWQRLIEPYRAGDWDECIRRARRAVDAEPFEPSPRQLLARLYARVDHPRLALLHYEKLMPIAVGRGDLFRALAIQRQIDTLLPPGTAPPGRYAAMQRWFRMVGRSLGIPSDPASAPGFTPSMLLALSPETFESMAAEMGVEELDLAPLETNTDGGSVWAVVMGRVRWSLDAAGSGAPALVEEGANVRIDDGVVSGLLRLVPEVPSECLRFDASLVARLAEPPATPAPALAESARAIEEESRQVSEDEPRRAIEDEPRRAPEDEPRRATEEPTRPGASPSSVTQSRRAPDDEPRHASEEEPLRASEEVPERDEDKDPGRAPEEEPRSPEPSRSSRPGEFDGAEVPGPTARPRLTIGVPPSNQDDLSAMLELMDFSIIDLNGPVPPPFPMEAGPLSSEARTFELFELEPRHGAGSGSGKPSGSKPPKELGDADPQSLPPARDPFAEHAGPSTPVGPAASSAERKTERSTPPPPAAPAARPQPVEPATDRRRHMRVTVALGSRVALVGMRDRSFGASVIDLSASGLALSLDLDEVGSVLRALDGSAIRLELQLPPDGRRLDLAGRVRSVGRASDGQTARVGVEFVMLTETDRAAIRLAVERTAESRPPRAA